MFVKVSDEFVVNTDKITHICIDSSDEDEYATVFFNEKAIYLSKKEFDNLDRFIGIKK